MKGATRRSASRVAPRLAGVALASLLWSGGPASAQEGAIVTGRVLDAVNLEPLPGAKVTLSGTPFTTATERDGYYRFAGVRPGTYTLVVSYLGYGERKKEVTLAEGATLTENFELNITFAELVEVSESAVDAQARALNQQRTAPNITNVVSADQIGRFPDPNAAEATQRIPGISIQRDMGEGRYVLIRGTEARLNSMLINGERVPSPEGDIRAVALDVIPADLLQSIEVSKALLPDMDGDAIGGAVNLVTKTAPEKPRFLATVGGGYNDLTGSGDQLTGGFTYGRRFQEDKLGLVLSGSLSRLTRASENFEVEYDDGDLDALENRRYDFTRNRYGVNAGLDYRPRPSTQLSLTGIFNYFVDDEVRNAFANAVGDGELEREVRAREEAQKIANVLLTGRHLAGRTDLDFRLSWARASESTPDQRYSVFLQEDVEFAPNVSPGAIDPDNIQANPQNEDFADYLLDSLTYAATDTRDRDLVGAVNARFFLSGGSSFSGWLKGGLKYRGKKKVRDDHENDFEVEDDVPFTSVSTRNVDPILDGRYRPGPFQLPTYSAEASRGLEEEINHEVDAVDFEASEDIFAAYGMASLQFGPRVQLVGGLRYEHTRLENTGYEVDFNEDGDYEGTRPLPGRDSYGQLLPMVHLRYGLGPRSNLRAAVTRTLARPNYYDLVPYRIVIREDEEIQTGNASLQPTTSWNFDLLAEHYFESVGVVSAGVFHKRLDNYIYLFNFEEDFEGDEFDVLQPRNGESATVTGFEVAFQRQLDFLASPFDGLGLYANYTFTDSEAEFPGREGAAASLPGQSRHVGNLALSYEKGGFLGRVALNFHGKYIDEVGEASGEDRYYDNHTQLDITASQALTRNVRLFAELLNLTNEPLRYYRGVPDRPDQEEYYRWWVSAGIKLDF
jgi:TonB-dependent receptor